jgi:outer membrane protein insertion porin family
MINGDLMPLISYAGLQLIPKFTFSSLTHFLHVNLLQTRSCSLEGSVKLKNLFGFCETWDASGALELDKTAELSAGVQMPRIGAIPTPLVARISFLSDDWLKSSLKEHLMGVSVGLLSTMNHNLAYNLTWRKLTDPTRMSSNSVQEELGHSLLSSIKYAYKVDQRDSSIRPTRGYAFLSSSQVGGLAPGSKYSRFLRQVYLPLSFLKTRLYITHLLIES